MKNIFKLNLQNINTYKWRIVFYKLSNENNNENSINYNLKLIIIFLEIVILEDSFYKVIMKIKIKLKII